MPTSAPAVVARRAASFDEAYRAHARTLTGLVTVRSGGGDQTLGDDDTPASWVSGHYFLLGVKMALRGFAANEDAGDGARGGRRSQLRLLTRAPTAAIRQ